MATRRLTALDATFLELEQIDEGATMHIGSVMIFDHLPGGGAPTLEQLCDHLTPRLGRLPLYSRRLSSPRTGGLSWPTWEEDPRFDVANHLRRATIPAPGSDAELHEWAGGFFSHRLDRTRPLWEIVLLDGLEGDRWALATKTHHAMVDGVGSVEVVHLLLDREPTPLAEPHVGPLEDEPAPLRESVLPRPPEAIAGLARTGAGAAAAAFNAAMHPREAFDRSRSLAELLVRDEVIASPRTSINVPTGAERRYTAVRASLDELRAIGREFGASVNDVILSLCASGLRRMLLSRADPLPPAGLRAMVPMNVREESDRMAMGNRVSSLFVDLPVSEPDPEVRLITIASRTRRLKRSGAALGAATMLDLAGLAPPVLHALVARSLYATRLFNLTITNVPGPQLPLYAFGAPLREVHPYVPLAAEHAVGVAIVSYDRHVVLGICADRDSTPDIGVLAEGIRDGLEELGELLGQGTPRVRRRISAGAAGEAPEAPRTGSQPPSPAA